MKNSLKKLEDSEVDFFVMRSFLSPAFEFDKKKAVYHMYYIKKNSNPDAYHKGYMNLKMRQMNRMEVSYFRENMQSYHEALKKEDGTIFNLNGRKFDRSICPTYKQYVLSL